jgi:hypothetical protein
MINTYDVGCGLAGRGSDSSHDPRFYSKHCCMGHQRFRVTKRVDDNDTVTGGEAYLCRNRMKTRVRCLGLCLQRD